MIVRDKGKYEELYGNPPADAVYVVCLRSDFDGEAMTFAELIELHTMLGSFILQKLSQSLPPASPTA